METQRQPRLGKGSPGLARAAVPGRAALSTSCSESMLGGRGAGGGVLGQRERHRHLPRSPGGQKQVRVRARKRRRAGRS